MNKTMFWGSVVVLTMLVLAIFTEKSLAQQPSCAPRDAVVESLYKRYGEVVIGQGIHSNGNSLAEVFVNSETGTWTIIGSNLNGMSCLVASGTDWTEVENAIPQIQEEG